MRSVRMWSMVLLLLAGVGTGMAMGQQAPAADEAETADGQRRERAISSFKSGRVTVGDVEDAVAQSSPLGRARYQRPDELERLHEQLLRLLLLADEAERQGFADHPQVRKMVMENAIQVLIRERFDLAQGADSIPAADVAKAYAQERAMFNRPELRRAGFILRPTKQDAEHTLGQIEKADLRAFRKLAREQTTHEPSQLRGGDLRYFDKAGRVDQQDDATVPPALVKAAFTLKEVGDVFGKVIPMDGGFAVLKLTGKRKAVSQPLEEVENTLRTRLWRERRREGVEGLIAQLKERHKPEVHAELIAQVTLAEPPPLPAAAGLPAQFPTQSPTQGEGKVGKAPAGKADQGANK